MLLRASARKSVQEFFASINSVEELTVARLDNGLKPGEFPSLSY
jgi:hypothetical protein